MADEPLHQTPAVTKHFLYLRGDPGVGKVTVARLLERDLGWRLFWFHDIKNAVFNVVREHRIPRLMDDVTLPIMKYLLEHGADIIYVRPSPDKATVERARQLLDQYPHYRFYSVRLTARRDTLAERVEQRDDPYRISSRRALDEYLDSRPVAAVEHELLIETDDLSPAEVAAKIKAFVLK
jgi:predicted kinase